MKKLTLLAGAFLLALAAGAQTTLVGYGTAWKYLDNGSNQGTAWKATTFNDAAWASGNAQLGYGDGDEATTVSYGADANNKYVTTYFRKVLSIADVNAYTSYIINMKRDDGMVVYINGTEVWRDNMPTGTIAYNTWASTTCSDDGATAQSITLTKAASMLVTGNNTIAVEMHQSVGTSSDITMDLQLQGQAAAGAGATITRGPYLQKLTQSSVVLRWRTNNAVDSKVSYGTSSSNLNLSTTVAGNVTEHTLTLTGLTSFTKYYYSIGSTGGVIQQGTDNNFITMPVNGTAGKYTFWVNGDCGNNSTNQANVLTQYNSYMGTKDTHAWILLGDNAYNTGADAEYTTNFFNIYQNTIMKHAPLFPAPGNHDYANDATNQDTHAVPYYSIFDLPTAGESGGVASNTEAYYSWDYGNIHFISLDSYGEESNKRLYDTTGTQAQWVKQDLAATTKKWKIAYWHHPPYTMGSHNSDSESDLAAIRTNFIKILERNGVDLIICGHSHVYERSKLMKGYTGNEASFSTSYNASQSTALYDGTANSCPYLKDASHTQGGTVYVVAGSAGSLGGTQSTWPHNAMYYSDATNGGSMVLEFDGTRLDAKWVCADGVIRDKFSIIKDANKTTPYTITSGQSKTLTASWSGSYVWSNGATTKSITVSPTANTTYTVRDQYTCLSDAFNITVNPARLADPSNTATAQRVSIYPNPFNNELTINYTAEKGKKVSLDVYNMNGQKVADNVVLPEAEGDQQFILNANEYKLSTGLYIIKVNIDGKNYTYKANYIAQ